MLNVFEQCPIYETKSFILRLVGLEDAEALLCIRFWLDEYKKKYYVRFALISKIENHAIRTVEIFGGDFGVLRIDLAKKYDTEEGFDEIARLAVDY